MCIRDRYLFMESNDLSSSKEIYSKLIQKRLDLKERIKEKLNDSYVGSQTIANSERSPFEKPKSHSRKPSNIKKQIKELSGQFSAREPRISAEISNKSFLQNQTENFQDKEKSKFDNILNTYFSALPSKLASPFKDSLAKKEGKFREVMDVMSGEISPRKLEKKKRTPKEKKSPMLRFKEIYDSMNNGNKATIQPAVTPGNKRSSIDLPPKDNICLLYTSPSPRDLSTSRMPSSA
eukprot:TRINITY_DN263_c0_g1_i2.p1 TRINITY_DN263_c0_g1~~TRINITY_DN263_c0_g1_i2.p1  ORF type:complete len:235 (-),score=68.79 TRINITY_DN263_c0_g1_i2:14-718(-)